jgi:hypothetical protein
MILMENQSFGLLGLVLWLPSEMKFLVIPFWWTEDAVIAPCPSSFGEL